MHEYATRSEQEQCLGKIIGVRWGDVNKGDSEEPECRSRLVGWEFAIGKDDALYAATPPLEALGIIISHAATFPDEGLERVIMINDVRRAYFYAKISRGLFIELPKEDPKHGTGLLGELKLCLYGIRDAAKGWQETLSAHLVSIGFERGRGHPCVFWHPEKHIKTLVHGDDYVSSGFVEAMSWLEKEFEKAYEIKTQKIGMTEGYKEERKVLNRVIRRTSDE